MTAFAWTVTILLTLAAGMSIQEDKWGAVLVNAGLAAWGFWVLLH